MSYLVTKFNENIIKVILPTFAKRVELLKITSLQQIVVVLHTAETLIILKTKIRSAQSTV